MTPGARGRAPEWREGDGDTTRGRRSRAGRGDEAAGGAPPHPAPGPAPPPGAELRREAAVDKGGHLKPKRGKVVAAAAAGRREAAPY